MADTRKRLGKGLDSLLSATRLEELQHKADTEAPSGASLRTHAREYVVELPVAAITTNPHQPRQTWNEKGIAELADSIRANGLVQPILVRRMGDGYQLIAGERRLRACELAGTGTVTAIVRDPSEDQMLEWALVENVHRTDLNPLERARAYRQYIERFSLTQQEVASRLGEDRSTIANYMRLLELPQPVRNALSEGRLSMGHARALLGAPEGAARERLADAAVARGLSVRQLERMVQAARKGPDGRTKAPADPHTQELETELTRAVGTKVTIQTSGRKKDCGRILIDFYSLDDFDRIRDLLQGNK